MGGGEGEHCIAVQLRRRQSLQSAMQLSSSCKFPTVACLECARVLVTAEEKKEDGDELEEGMPVPSATVAKSGDVFCVCVCFCVCPCPSRRCRLAEVRSARTNSEEKKLENVFCFPLKRKCTFFCDRAFLVCEYV